LGFESLLNIIYVSMFEILYQMTLFLHIYIYIYQLKPYTSGTFDPASIHLKSPFLKIPDIL